MSTACSKANTSRPVRPSNMPVTVGYVEGREVSVLRDTGCSLVVVRTGLVPKGSFTGQRQSCVLLDGTVSEAPLA